MHVCMYVGWIFILTGGNFVVTLYQFKKRKPTAAQFDDINNIQPSRIIHTHFFTVSLHRTSLCAFTFDTIKKKGPYFGSLGTSAVGPRFADAARDRKSWIFHNRTNKLRNRDDIVYSDIIRLLAPPFRNTRRPVTIFELPLAGIE
jgi:hypothetical protein